MRWTALAVLLATCGLACARPEPSSLPARSAPPTPVAPPPLRIAFGSCHEVAAPRPLWGHVAALAPDAFVWLGDIVYADTEDMEQMRGRYLELAGFEPYAALARSTRILGTWDDHDYGRDNAGKEYPQRARAQQLLLDFLGEPADSPRRTQQGVYAVADLGNDPYRVRVILLDTRYHRDAPGPTGDILGEAQWSWLRAQLQGSTAAAHVIASSIQLVADEHIFEKWSDFPAARTRLLALLDELAPANTLVISGDRHFAELSKLERDAGKPALYDLTSSSLSKPLLRPAEEPNRQRLGPIVQDVNFGLLELDWRAQPPVVRLQVRDASGAAVIDQAVPLRRVDVAASW